MYWRRPMRRNNPISNKLMDARVRPIYRMLNMSMIHWIDLKSKTITLQDTKNHEIHTLPMSDFVYELMERRSRNKTSEFVFPAESKTGYIYEPKKAVNRVVELSGVSFTLHDLRRTFATIADSLDLPAYALKRLLNHKMNNDVTAGYIMKDVERLRKPMQQVANFILKHMMETADIS